MEVPSQQTIFVLRLDVEDLVAELQNLPNFLFFQEPRTRICSTGVATAEIHLPIDVLSNVWQALGKSGSNPPNQSYWSTFCASLCDLQQRLTYVAALGALASYFQGSSPSTPPSSKVVLCEENPKTDFELKSRLFIENNQTVLCPEGVGGTYFVQDTNGEKFGVFKPADEEPGAPLNPKKLVDNPLLPPGGGAIREVAAYALDRGFAGVPPTFLVENVQTPSGPKTGSVQQFIANEGESSSVGCSSFAVEDVHRIGIQDIRLFNMDRNGENMLIRREGDRYRLIPIDHSYILPDKLDGAYFDWMFWPQAKQPFSPEELEYIKSIDLVSDVLLLRKLGIPEASIKSMVMSTILLKHCASIGKNLYEIASLVCRDISGAPCQLENFANQIKSLEDETVESLFEKFSALVVENM